MFVTRPPLPDSYRDPPFHTDSLRSKGEDSTALAAAVACAVGLPSPAGVLRVLSIKSQLNSYQKIIDEYTVNHKS